MLTICIILIVLLALDLLFTLALRCRKGHPKWELLKKYRYAHRGFHDKPVIPENSLPAFRRAIEHGFGAELDVHLLKDSTLAVFHDSDLRRCANADGQIEDLTLEELKHREPDEKPAFRAKVAVVGSEIDDPSLTKLIEDCGALVVSDRYCFGSTPGREVIELNDDEPALDQICRHYMEVSECARYISDEKVAQRRQTADRLAREYNADGIIYEQMKFCDYWGFERALASHIMSTEMGWPVLSIDRPYNARSSGQLRTRFQAFVESLEIKRIQKNGGSN